MLSINSMSNYTNNDYKLRLLKNKIDNANAIIVIAIVRQNAASKVFGKIDPLTIPPADINIVGIYSEIDGNIVRR